MVVCLAQRCCGRGLRLNSSWSRHTSDKTTGKRSFKKKSLSEVAQSFSEILNDLFSPPPSLHLTLSQGSDRDEVGKKSFPSSFSFLRIYKVRLRSRLKKNGNLKRRIFFFHVCQDASDPPPRPGAIRQIKKKNSGLNDPELFSQISWASLPCPPE